MQCPTCGKTVARGQEICSYCGALVSAPAGKVSTAPGGPSSPVFHEIGPMRTPDIPPFAPPQMEGEEAFPVPPPAAFPRRPAPPAQSVQPPQPARLPPAPAWTRWIGPLFLILIFAALDYWRNAPNSPPSGSSSSARSSAPAAKLAMTDAGFCKTLSDSQPAERTSAFSASGDSQAIFFSTWKGNRSGHQFSVRWRAPDGSEWEAPQPTVGRQSAQGEFIVAAALPLQASMPLGEWHAELFRDGKLNARYAFRVEN